MRRHIIYILLCLLPTHLMAHDYGSLPTHALAVWGSAGYVRLDNHASETQPIGGAGAGIGIGYELGRMHQGFLFQTGVSLSPQFSKMGYTAFIDERLMYDTEGTKHTVYFRFDNTQERDVLVNANLHLLMGYRWRNGWYLLGGPKVVYDIYANGTTTTDVTTSARYDGLIGDDGNGSFSDMPNHFLQTVTREHTQSLERNPYVGLSLECGYTFKRTKLLAPSKADYATWRLAFFCEYGWRVNGSANGCDVIVNQGIHSAYQPVVSNYLYRGQDAVTQLSFGLKVTYLIEYKSASPCMLCQ